MILLFCGTFKVQVILRFAFVLMLLLCQTACKTYSTEEILQLANKGKTDVLLHQIPLAQFSLPPGTVPLIRKATGDTVVSQSVVTGQDTSIYFYTRVRAGEQVTLSFSPTGIEQLPSFRSFSGVHLGVLQSDSATYAPVDAHIRPPSHRAHAKPFLYQFEGPGWENDVIGFRHYFDERNGRDIFGKTTDNLVLSSVGLGEDYHSLQPWGMDILKVGNSLGAGALALLKHDSLYRLGHTNKASVEILENGPLVSKIAFVYQGWKVADQEYDVTEHVTLLPGRHFYTSEVHLDPVRPGDTLVTGLPNLKSMPLRRHVGEGWQIAYTHGEQSENSDNLGMAIATRDAQFYAADSIGFEIENGVADSYLVYLAPDRGKYTFHFFAAWAVENPKYQTEDAFKTQILYELDQISNNIHVTFNP